jgi:hypothetical protein
LKEDGYFYCIVPNIFTNTADFVVADHVNHFSEPSIETLLNKTGFEVVEIDSDSHYGAFVIVARKSNGSDFVRKHMLTNKLSEKVETLAQYWKNVSLDIKTFEEAYTNENIVTAIYGAGFYGTFIASCLSNLDNVIAFIDQNPFRQNMELLGKKIISPERVPETVGIIYVGLNPRIAVKIIESIDCLYSKNIRFYYL